MRGLWRHEWQHSIFNRSLELLDTDMAYAERSYRLPSGPGLGAVPGKRFWEFAQRVE
jgi:galactonate dehydratase